MAVRETNLFREERNADLDFEISDARQHLLTFMVYMTNDQRANLLEFKEGILNPKSTLTFKVTPRGWDIEVKEPGKKKISLSKRRFALNRD